MDSMIYTWCEFHGVKWFYKNNDGLEDWIFTDNRGRKRKEMAWFVKKNPREVLRHLEKDFS